MGKRFHQKIDHPLYVCVVLLQERFHRVHCVDYRAVVAPAETLADFLKRVACQLSGNEHGNLARERNRRGAAFAAEVFGGKMESVGGALLDFLDVDGCPVFLNNIVGKKIRRLFKRDYRRRVYQGAVADELVERALHSADVLRKFAGDEIEDIRADLRSSRRRRLFAQNRKARFVVGHLDVGSHPPRETRNETLFDVLNLVYRLVARKDNLLVCVEKLVEFMKKFEAENLK